MKGEIQMKRLGLLISLIMIASLLAACATPTPEVVKEQVTKIVEVEKVVTATSPPPTPTPAPKHGGILTYGLVTDPVRLDPHIRAGAADRTVRNQVYQRLFTWDRELNVVPELAESYEMPNDTTIVITLRQGVKWHNGDELTSEDVKFSYDRILNPEIGANAHGAFLGIVVEAPDDYTVKLTLPAPDASVFNALARTDASIINKKWVEGGADLNLEMMGTGPFKYKDREVNISFEVERFDDYWDQPLPYLDGIKFIPYPDETAKITALRTGVIDMTDYIPWRHMNTIEKEAEEGKLKFYSGRHALFMLLYMNPSAPPFDDKRVRQAVSWAFDRETYGASTFFGRGEALTGSFIPKIFLGYDASLDGTYGYDPEKAKSLLEEVGWRDEDGDGVREAHGVAGVEDGTPFVIQWLACSQFAMHYRQAELGQAFLKEVGMDGTIELVDWPTRVQRRLDVPPWELASDGLSQNITDPAFLNTYFHSEKGQWPESLHFADPKLDAMLDEAQAEYDEEKRGKMYHEIDKYIADMAYIVITWRREQGEASQTYVMNFAHLFSTSSYLTLPEVWLDK